MLGTENIKELLDYGFSLVTRITEIRAADSAGGSKITWAEVLGSIGLITKIPRIIGSADDAYAEWLDLDDEEIVEIRDHFAYKFDLANDKMEAIFEEVWGIILSIGRVIALLDDEA